MKNDIIYEDDQFILNSKYITIKNFKESYGHFYLPENIHYNEDLKSGNTEKDIIDFYEPLLKNTSININDKSNLRFNLKFLIEKYLKS